MFNNVNKLKKFSVILLMGGFLSACGAASSSSGPVVYPDKARTTFPVAALCLQQSDAQMAEILAQINDIRSVARTCGNAGSFSATSSVQWNNRLEDMAYGHSKDMADNGFFAHESTNGDLLADRADNNGYKYQVIGEDLGENYASLNAVLDGWLASDLHCQELMRNSYREIGLACVKSNTGTQYWTLNLGVQALGSSAPINF